MCPGLGGSPFASPAAASIRMLFPTQNFSQRPRTTILFPGNSAIIHSFFHPSIQLPTNPFDDSVNINWHSLHVRQCARSSGYNGKCIQTGSLLQRAHCLVRSTNWMTQSPACEVLGGKWTGCYKNIQPGRPTWSESNMKGFPEKNDSHFLGNPLPSPHPLSSGLSVHPFHSSWGHPLAAPMWCSTGDTPLAAWLPFQSVPNQHQLFRQLHCKAEILRGDLYFLLEQKSHSKKTKQKSTCERMQAVRQDSLTVSPGWAKEIVAPFPGEIAQKPLHLHLLQNFAGCHCHAQFSIFCVFFYPFVNSR